MPDQNETSRSELQTALRNLRTKIAAWATIQLLEPKPDWQRLIDILAESERETTPIQSIIRKSEYDQTDMSTGVLLFSAGK